MHIFLRLLLIWALSFTSANSAVAQQFIAKPIASPPAMQVAPQANQVLTRDEAVRLALLQTSPLQQAKLNEQIAGEDLQQSQKAFLPKLSGSVSTIYTSPAPGVSIPATPSFIGANAITEHQGLVGVTGEIDLNGRLRASVKRNQALLEAARAGTLVARRNLEAATDEAYYILALAIARRLSAEQILSASQEFERITELLLQGGEVAEIDLVRARLQTNRRLDELAQARTDEAASADGLRVLIAYDFAAPILTTALTASLISPTDIDRFTAEAISHRPELAQLDAERIAAEQEAIAAKAERRPQFSYSLNSGFISDSFKPSPLHNHTGVSATVNLTIPLFDWGISKSREQQAKLRAESIASEKSLALRTFAQQFYTARAQALAAINRVQIAAQGMPDAERNLTASVARYRAGEAQIVEVTDAQNTLAAQRLALYQALFDYQIARSRLAQASGQ
jgi:outer membrane protein TolC